MERSDSKKSPTDLASSLKRIKMNGSGAVGEEPETPAQKVFRLPELVSEIFGHLADESDFKSLNNAGAVCTVWKHEVFITLRNNLLLVPYIADENSKDLIEHLENPKTLQISNEKLMPGCRFPLKLQVNEWTPDLETFIKKFSNSREIVHFELCGPFRGFPAQLGEMELPISVRHISLIAYDICGDEEKRVELVRALTFWRELVRVSNNLKTSYVHLDISESDPLPPDNQAFDLIEWSKVDRLHCSYEFFANIRASTELSGLQDLACYSSHDNGRNEDGLLEQISLAKAPHLSKVHLGAQVEWILNHEMKSLKELNLVGTTISGEQPPSELVPNLEDVYISEESMEGRSFSGLTSGGGAFEKAVKLSLSESWMNSFDDIGDIANQLCDSFPNLTDLFWKSANDENEDLDEDVDNNNALYAAPVIFSRLEFLTTLELCVVLPSEQEVVELVTGISLKHIPKKEHSWPTALVNNHRSITALEYLEKFSLILQAVPVTVNSRHTRFLFAAAFRTMEALEELYFAFIDFEDISCATEWVEMGRQITLEV